MRLRTLLVDNYDSYTFNLFQLIADVNGLEPVVVTNDDPVLTRLSAGDFDNVVLSPGPGRPQCPRDIFVADLLQTAEWPVLGVCLGHQAIGYLAGGEVGLAPEPRHGHLSQIRHHGDDLFAGIPAVFTGVRYHSPCVAEPLPETLIATAWAEDGVIMALRHRDLPRWGVQFHPESIATQYGQEILANFAELTDRARGRLVGRPAGPGRTKARHSAIPGPQPSAGPGPQPDRGIADLGAGRVPDGSAGLRLITQVVHTPVDTEQVFTELFASSPSCFWLDSSLAQAGLARFSFLGDGSGPLSETLTYRVGDVGVEIHDAGGVRMAEGNAFDVLDRRLGKRQLQADAELPFDFTAGYVGYFGYEMKADCGADTAHRAPTPDGLWIFADPGPTQDFMQAVAGRLPAAGRWFPRVELVLDAGTPHFQLWIRPVPPPGRTVRLWLPAAPDGRTSPGIKGPDLDWLAQQRAAAVAAGADEAVLLSRSGRVLEGATTSILWWRGDEPCAPPEDAGVLPGVTRLILLDLAASIGAAVSFRCPRPDELAGLEVWAVNALHGIRPVTGWVGADIEPGPACRVARWQRYLEEFVIPVAAGHGKEPANADSALPAPQAWVRARPAGRARRPLGPPRGGQEGRARPGRALRPGAARLPRSPGAAPGAAGRAVARRRGPQATARSRLDLL